jgi:signal transduction histidine kinase
MGISGRGLVTGAAGVWPGVVGATRRLARSPDWPLLSAVAVGAVAVLELRLAPGRAGGGGDAVDLLMALLTTLPLALRRRGVALTAALVSGAMLLTVTTGQAWTFGAAFAQLFALYLLALRYGRLAAVPAGLAVVALVALPVGSFRPSGAVSVAVLVAAFSALALGDAARARRRAFAERDASARAMADAQEDRALVQERTRIARDLHDVVAHHVSMIAVQAETARLTTPGMTEQGQERLRAISATAREAMAEMRRLLGVLRSDAAETADRSPRPGLDRLDELVDGARAAGTTIRVAVGGERRPLAPGVDLTAYRIIQEALTNVRRHAPGAAVDLELAYEADLLRIRVRDGGDEGKGPATVRAGGHGLLGMRERAAAVGGHVHAGPGEERGFVVTAELPTGRWWP